MKGRFAETKRPAWDLAILSFRSRQSSTELVQRVRASPVDHKTVRGFEGANGDAVVYETVIGQKRIGIVPQCVWGGPQAAILVEEIACLGVKQIIGFGVAGGIVPNLATGTQIVAAVGITSDGTSRAYTDQVEVGASPALLALLPGVAAAQNVEIVPVKVATVDAFYQETETLLALWRRQAVQAINMETAPLYAASAFCRVESLWLGHIADRLVDQTWESGVRPQAVTTTTIDILLGLVECID